MLSRRLFLAAVSIFAAMLPASAYAQGWSWTGGDGVTVSLDHVPTRIVAHANAAAGLIPLGIRPIGIYADGPIAEDQSLKGLDLTGIEIVGETWGEIDVEKVAALQPDLIVAEFWPLEKAWSGLEPGVEGKSRQIAEIAPITGVTQGPSIVAMIEDYEKLTASLGADLTVPEVAADKARFEAALEGFKAATAAKPNLTVLAVWAGTDGLYVAAVEGAAELSDFASWGLNIISPEVADDRGYWETLSWEQADKYQPDLIIVDDRQATTMETAKAQPMWTAMKAAEAGQVTDWPAFWMRNYRVFAQELEALTATINSIDENLTE
jgi:iron complex transport system substrate-binding protein